ncbi:MAG TPA: hypothetical protein VNA27_00240 [Rubrobacteraceae bacterium]|nr:hypothetical protein [Rubrobacteraceae bacterium]
MRKTPPVGWQIVPVAALLAPCALQVLLDIRRSLRRRATEDAERRIALKLPVFKLTRSRHLVNLLMADPAVLEAVEKHSREHGETQTAGCGAERYALEIVPYFSPYLYFRIGLPLAGLVSRAL